ECKPTRSRGRARGRYGRTALNERAFERFPAASVRLNVPLSGVPLAVLNWTWHWIVPLLSVVTVPFKKPVIGRLSVPRFVARLHCPPEPVTPGCVKSAVKATPCAVRGVPRRLLMTKLGVGVVAGLEDLLPPQPESPTSPSATTTRPTRPDRLMRLLRRVGNSMSAPRIPCSGA